MVTVLKACGSSDGPHECNSIYDREEKAIGFDNYIFSGYIEDIYKKIFSDDADCDRWVEKVGEYCL